MVKAILRVTNVNRDFAPKDQPVWKISIKLIPMFGCCCQKLRLDLFGNPPPPPHFKAAPEFGGTLLYPVQGPFPTYSQNNWD